MTACLPCNGEQHDQILPAAAISPSDIIAANADLLSPQKLDELWDLLNEHEPGVDFYSTDDAVFQTEEDESLFWTTVINTNELPLP